MKNFSWTPLVFAAALALTLPAAAQTGGAAGGTAGAPGNSGSSTGGSSTGSGNSGSTGTGNSSNSGNSGNSGSGNATTPAGGTSAQGGAAHPGAKSGAVAAADRTFMMKAAGSGLYEVEASRLAAERARNGEVKEFAQRMVSDHDKANQELMALASARGVALPPQMPADKRKEVDRLAKAKNFDADYMRNTGVKEHQAAVALFEKASKSAKDAELKAWAAEKLPTLREHLAHAQKIKPGNIR